MKIYRIYNKYYEVVTKKHYIIIAHDKYEKQYPDDKNGYWYFHVKDSTKWELLDWSNFCTSKKECIEELKARWYL